MTKLYKLARPKMYGVPIEILNGKPFVIDRVKRKFADKVNVIRSEVTNNMVNDILGGMPQFAGDIVVGNPINESSYTNTVDFLGHASYINLFVLWVYDMKTSANLGLRERLGIAEGMMHSCGANIQFVDHELIQNEKELAAYKYKVIGQNFFPGIVLREPFGTYGTEDEIIEEASAVVSAS